MAGMTGTGMNPQMGGAGMNPQMAGMTGTGMNPQMGGAGMNPMMMMMMKNQMAAAQGAQGSASAASAQGAGTPQMTGMTPMMNSGMNPMMAGMNPMMNAGMANGQGSASATPQMNGMTGMPGMNPMMNAGMNPMMMMMMKNHMAATQGGATAASAQGAGTPQMTGMTPMMNTGMNPMMPGMNPMMNAGMANPMMMNPLLVQQYQLLQHQQRLLLQQQQLRLLEQQRQALSGMQPTPVAVAPAAPAAPAAATATAQIKIATPAGPRVVAVPATATTANGTRYITMRGRGGTQTLRIVRGGAGGQAVLVPQPSGRVSVLQNYQRQMQAIRVPPGFTVRRGPDGRIFLCPAKANAKSFVASSGILTGDTRTLQAELVPYPENKEDKAELKEWDKAWVKAFKAKSKEGDLTTNMMLAHLRRIMLMDKHGLYDTFSKSLAESKEKASLVAASEDTSADKFLDVVQTTVEALYSALLKHYSALRDEPYDSWAQNGLYEMTFQNLYNCIFTTYTNRYKKEDDEFFQLCKKFAYATPAHLGLPKKFWLTDAQAVPEDTPLNQVPYGSAISALSEIDKMHSHMSKVVAFVESAHRIYTSVEKYWEGKPDKPSKLEIAADEFLPLFSYVIIRSHIATGTSSLSFINDFMTEQECSGEPGYYFATFQSAFQYVQSLTEKDLDDAYKDAWGIPRPDREESQPKTPTTAEGDDVATGIEGITDESLTELHDALLDGSSLPPPDFPVPGVPGMAPDSPPVGTVADPNLTFTPLQ